MMKPGMLFRVPDSGACIWSGIPNTSRAARVLGTCVTSELLFLLDDITTDGNYAFVLTRFGPGYILRYFLRTIP